MVNLKINQKRSVLETMRKIMRYENLIFNENKLIIQNDYLLLYFNASRNAAALSLTFIRLSFCFLFILILALRGSNQTSFLTLQGILPRSPTLRAPLPYHKRTS